jgi:solute carrier family 25 oxoglutarate transporter 11
MDYGMRLASLHKFWGGTWSPVCFNDFNTLKYLLFSYISAFPVCWTGIPLEVARKAYFADQSWPADLRKGYRSPLHALLKIPLTEGPLYLFKGGLPTYLGNVQLTAVTFFSYTWLKNKLFFLWVYNDINYSWVKFWILNFSFAWGAFWGYPFYTLREMMEVWPKERGGRCTFQGSYWNSVKFLRQYYDSWSSNFYSNYWRWFRTQGIIFYIAIWEADNMGLFTNNMSDFNTIYNTVSHAESD